MSGPSAAATRAGHPGWRRAVGGLALATTVLLAGCGVPQQEVAQPLPSDVIPPPVPQPTEPTPSARLTKVYFVSGRQLVAQPEPLLDRSANGVMAALAAGPPAEVADELRTLLRDPLTGAPILVVTAVSPSGQVVLQAASAYSLLPATDQVLLMGQVVHSMDEIGLASVLVTDGAGKPLALALPDGRVQEGPTTAEDYASLLA